MTTWENEERVLAIMGATMRDREIYRIHTYEEHHSYRTIGMQFGISSERVRQIVSRTQKMLNHPLAREILALDNAYDWNIHEHDNDVWQKGYHQQFVDHGGLDIANLDISVRSYNCLRRQGYDYVTEIPLDVNELIRIRGLGKRCAHEIITEVRRYLGKEE